MSKARFSDVEIDAHIAAARGCFAIEDQHMDAQDENIARRILSGIKVSEEQIYGLIEQDKRQIEDLRRAAGNAEAPDFFIPPDPYLIDGTTALKNRLDIDDVELLQRAERRFAFKGRHEFLFQFVSAAAGLQNFDLDFYKSIHRGLFENVYPWAGDFRTINMSKGNSIFASISVLKTEGEKAFSRFNRSIQTITQNRDGKISEHSFVAKTAALLGDLNALHPFRDGNGRSQRLLIQCAAMSLGFSIAWDRITPRQMIDASIHSHNVDESLLEELLTKSVKADSRPSQELLIFFS